MNVCTTNTITLIVLPDYGCRILIIYLYAFEYTRDYTYKLYRPEAKCKAKILALSVD